MSVLHVSEHIEFYQTILLSAIPTTESKKNSLVRLLSSVMMIMCLEKQTNGTRVLRQGDSLSAINNQLEHCSLVMSHVVWKKYHLEEI